VSGKSCNKKFTLESEAGFEKMQVTSKMVTVALDLYFKGTSLRKIVDHLEQFYERKLGHTTVLHWVKIQLDNQSICRTLRHDRGGFGTLTK
jgi:hypothetical protein